MLIHGEVIPRACCVAVEDRRLPRRSGDSGEPRCGPGWGRGLAGRLPRPGRNDPRDVRPPFGDDHVAAANPRTFVVLETGGLAAMPWIDSVGAAIEFGYPGIRGAEALADIPRDSRSPLVHGPFGSLPPGVLSIDVDAAATHRTGGRLTTATAAQVDLTGPAARRRDAASRTSTCRRPPLPHRRPCHRARNSGTHERGPGS
jgi:hypothetical protein